MPRKSRIISSTGIYHVILRSVNQQIIFEEEADYQKFLYILSDCKSKYDVDVYAYCLMDNHIHLLVNASENNLPTFFRSLGSLFVRWYNGKYDRYGHLFQERYYSRPVEDERYYLNTLIYIHNNPVAAGICRFPSEYYWSSYNIYYGKKSELVDCSFSWKVAGSKEALLDYFAKNSNNSEIDNSPEKYDCLDQRHYTTDEIALEKYKRLTGLPTTFDIYSLSRSERNRIIRLLKNNGLTRNQISRLLGVSISTIQRICKNFSDKE